MLKPAQKLPSHPAPPPRNNFEAHSAYAVWCSKPTYNWQLAVGGPSINRNLQQAAPRYACGPSRPATAMAATRGDVCTLLLVLLLAATTAHARVMQEPAASGEVPGGAFLPRAGAAGGPEAAAPAEAVAAAADARHVSGAAAVSALAGPAKLSKAAASVGWSTAKLRRQLALDSSLKLDPETGRLLYACSFDHSQIKASARSAAASSAAVRPAEITPPAQSDPPSDQAFKLHRCVPAA